MWGPMMAWGGFGWLWMLFGALLWLIFLGVIVWAVVRLTSPGSGRSGLSRLILGSVAQRVLQQTEVPLLLLRPAV